MVASASRPSLPAGVDPETGEIVSPAVGYETGSGSAPRSVNPSEQGHTVSAPGGEPLKTGDASDVPASPAPGADTPSDEVEEVLGGAGMDTERPAPVSSTEPLSDERREGEEPGKSGSRQPAEVTPSRRPCLHLNGTRSHHRESDGARIEVCVDCGAVIEMVRGPA